MSSSWKNMPGAAPPMGREMESREPAGGFRFGAYELCLRRKELRKQGVRIKLQEKPFQVLCLLAEKAGETVPREDFRRRLWPADTYVDFDANLNTALAKVRQALEESAENPRFVETIPRLGYRFITPVESWEAADDPTPATAPSRPCSC